MIGEEIWSFLRIASLIFHVYQLKIKVGDSEGRRTSEGRWTSKEENSDFIAVLLLVCTQDGGRKGKVAWHLFS